MATYSLGTAQGEIVITANTSGVTEANRAMQGLNQSSQSTDQAINKTANVMGIAGAAIAGGLGLAVKTAADFEEGLSGIQAVSGATAGQMDQVRQKALQIGADTKFGATEAASAIEELVKAGIPLPAVMSGAADATVALAAATGVDMPTAAAIASNAMNVFGIEAKDMDGVVNKMAQTANASAIDVTDLGMSMQQVGAVANLAGLSFEDTMIAIGEMGDAGIKGSDAGTSLKTMLMSLQPQTEKQSGLMRDLGIITEDGTNQFYNQEGHLKSLRDIQEIMKTSLAGMSDAQKQAALETIFGSDAIRAGAVLTKAGADGYDAFAKKQTESGTAAEQAKTRQDNLNGSIEQLKGSAETAAITIGSALSPMIRGLADGLGAVVGWFNSLTPTQQQWVAGVAAGAAGLLLLTAGILKSIMMFRSMIQTMQTLRILSTATQTGFIRMAAVAVANFIKMAAQAAVSAVATGASWAAAAARAVASWALMAAQATANAVRVAAAWLITNGAAALSSIASMAVAVAATVAGWIVMAVTAMANAVIAAAAWFIALGPIGWAIAALIAVVAFVVIFWDDIVKFFKAGAEKVAEWLQNAWDWVVDKWNGIVNAFKAAGQWIADVMNRIGEGIRFAWDVVVNVFQMAGQKILDAVNQAWNWVTNVWNNILNFIRGIPGWIGNVFSAAGSWLVGAGQSILSGLWNGISAIWNGLIGWIRGIPGWIMGIFGGAIGWLAGVGRDLISGLWNGITGMFNWVMGKIRGFASSILNGIKSFFGIGSPSKLFRDEVGKWLPAGLAVGIDANAEEAMRAAQALAEGVTASVAMSTGGPDSFWDNTPLGAGYVPPSGEVASYSAAQGRQATTNITTNVYNPVAEKASDSEARRLRALSAMGAF